ncbi:MAG: DUF4252 domain-containing protein [Paludibacteraceae bacterium]|nr:DUF4252 domain-containing protein [Paludibacteraceae bacterium]
MKRTLTTIAVLLALIFTAQAQSLQKFFEKYADDERFQYVAISKGMMNMASVFGGMAKDEKKMMQKMDGLKILSLEATSESQIMKVVLLEMDQIVNKGDFESAVEARDKGQRVNIYYRVTGSVNADMLIITREKSQFNCIWIRGKMTREELLNSFSKSGMDLRIGTI